MFGGRRLAAVTVHRDSTLFVFDLADPAQGKAVRLYNPTTQQDVRAYVTLFADALDWDHAGERVLFDAFNSVDGDSTTLEFWRINVLDVDNELIKKTFAAFDVDGSGTVSCHEYLLYSLCEALGATELREQLAAGGASAGLVRCKFPMVEKKVEVRPLADELAELADAQVVQIIGHTALFFRRTEHNRAFFDRHAA